MEEAATVDTSTMNEIARLYFGGNATQKSLSSTYGYSRSQISLMCKSVRADMMHYYCYQMKDAITKGEDQQHANNRIVEVLSNNYEMSKDLIVEILSKEFETVVEMQKFSDDMLRKSALFMQILEYTPRAND